MSIVLYDNARSPFSEWGPRPSATESPVRGDKKGTWETSYSMHRLYVVAHVRTTASEQTASLANDPGTSQQLRLYVGQCSAPETQDRNE